MSRDITVVIPARAGSKGIKNKNLQTVGGKTLVHRAVESVLSAGVKKVYVYSDSDKILKEGVLHGAEPVTRPVAVSGDKVTTEATIQRFIQDQKVRGAVMVVQVTTPFLKAKYIRRAIEKWESKRYDSVVSVALNERFIGSYTQIPYEFIPQWPERQLRQELDNKSCCWLETGAFYLASSQLWKAGKRIGNKCGVIVHHSWEAVEIDEEIDLKICDAIAPIMEEL